MRSMSTSCRKSSSVLLEAQVLTLLPKIRAELPVLQVDNACHAWHPMAHY